MVSRIALQIKFKEAGELKNILKKRSIIIRWVLEINILNLSIKYLLLFLFYLNKYSN